MKDTGYVTTTEVQRGKAFAWIKYTYAAPSNGLLNTQVLFCSVHAEGTAREATASGAEVPHDTVATDTGHLYVRIKNNTTGIEKPKVESSLGRGLPLLQGKADWICAGEDNRDVQEFRFQVPSQAGKRK
jgi:hypothetical protein